MTINVYSGPLAIAADTRSDSYFFHWVRVSQKDIIFEIPLVELLILPSKGTYVFIS